MTAGELAETRFKAGPAGRIEGIPRLALGKRFYPYRISKLGWSGGVW